MGHHIMESFIKMKFLEMEFINGRMENPTKVIRFFSLLKIIYITYLNYLFLNII